MNKKLILSYGIKQGIARKLILYMLLFSSFVTIILTSIQLYLEYARDMRQIENQIETIEKSHLATISNGLWSFDEEMLKVELDGILQMHDIQYLEIRPNVGQPLSAGTFEQKNVIRKEFKLSFLYKEKEIQVGTLLVDVSLSGVFHRLFNRASIILLSQAVKTFVVSLFIFFIFHFLVTRYVNTVVNYVSGFNLNSLDTKLKLNRKQKKGTTDELDKLVSGINQMRTNLLIDITKRKEVEEKLRQKEKDLEASQHIAHLGSWRLDLRTNQVVWTEELYKMYGFDPTLPPPPYTEHMKLFTPESWDKLSSALAMTSKTGIPYELELETVRTDGSHGWVWVRGETVNDSTGNTVGLWGAAQDITERKLETERYKKTIESSFDGFWIVDINGNFLEVNDAYSNMIGFNRDELLKMSIMDVEANERSGETKARIEKIVKAGRDQFESQHRHKKGHIIDVEVSATFTQDHGGQFFVFLRDITNRNQMEERLRQAQRMESIGNLAGGIAHDFNNILFPIMGFAEMLREDLPDGSPEKENAQEIFNAGKRGGELVQRILAFSRQTEHKLRPVRVQQVLKEVLKLTRSTIPIDIEIHQDVQQDCGLVMSDATQLHQISMNLITNAYHAVEKKSGKISVQLKEIMLDNDGLQNSSLQPGKYVMLSVSDDGIGIPGNMMNKIFEPYFTTKEKGKGTGLGLAVVYGIIKEHKGDIKVYSEEGKGTTFNVYIPLMKKSIETVETDSVSVLPTGVERLLLVDDEKSVVRLEKQMLERLGYNVVAQSSSIDALEIFKANPDDYDLVVTDMTMPNMTGDKLAKEILAVRSDMPVIICTGFSERINKEQAEALGVNGFLMKPVVKSEMAQMVRKVLDAAKMS